MRIAILTALDFAKPGGAERHIADMAMALRADIVSPYIGPEAEIRLKKAGIQNIISFQSPLPSEPMRQVLGMLFFRKLRISYDFVIPTDDMAVRFLVKKVPHLYYMFTPRRALYDMYYPFIGQKRGLKKYIYIAAFAVMRSLDRSFVNKHVSEIACNSHNVRNRIYKVYQKEATVVYAPVHTSTYQYIPSQGFWLSVGRVDKWKRIELQVEAFRGMPNEKLIIAGPVYPGCQKLVENAPDNVKFLGSRDEATLISLYSGCTGVITTSVDEDFGLTPVESMASGKPVIATKEGGHMESVLDGITGILIAPTINELQKAVTKISSSPESYKDACISRAKLFDREKIADEMRNLIQSIVSGG